MVRKKYLSHSIGVTYYHTDNKRSEAQELMIIIMLVGDYRLVCRVGGVVQIIVQHNHGRKIIP